MPLSPGPKPEPVTVREDPGPILVLLKEMPGLTEMFTSGAVAACVVEPEALIL